MRVNPLRQYKFVVENFNSIGLIAKVFEDKDGLRVGPAIYYNSDGTLFAAGSYKKTDSNNRRANTQIGLWKYYNENGRMKKEIIFIK